MDKLVYLITSFGSEHFYVAALAFIYWIWDKHKGYRLAMVLLSSMLVNNWLKFACAIPRPQPSNKVRVIFPETGGGYAFPSGHAQGSTTSWGWLSHEIRTRRFCLLSGIVIFLVSVSRIYLNVHWPVDVIGGFFIGLAWVGLWQLIFRNYDETRWSPYLRLASSFFIPMLLFLIYPKGDSPMLLGLLMGLPLGRYLDERYLGWNERAATKQQCLKVVTGGIGYGALRYGLRALFDWICPGSGLLNLVRYTLIALWTTFVAPLVFVKLGWAGCEKQQLHTEG